MSIVVEDGTLVTGANSWVTRAEYIAYAKTKGITIHNSATADTDLVKACEFINSHEDNLKGDKVSRGQPTAYPRKYLVLEGFSWGSDEIPRQVILCQLAVALDINAGIDPYNPPANPAIQAKKEKVDVIEVEYFGRDSGQKMSRTSTATAILNTLLRRSGLQIALVRS